MGWEVGVKKSQYQRRNDPTSLVTMSSAERSLTVEDRRGRTDSTGKHGTFSGSRTGR